MSRSVPADLRRAVREHFDGRCAYCQSPEALVVVTFEVEHITPLSRGGAASAENLCLACPMCNRHKADRVSGIDPASGLEAPLFHPRLQAWPQHFDWDPPALRVVGLSATARATIQALRINRDEVVSVRELWVRLGKHPPT